MSVPKFSVGEVVVLQSEKYPEYNGEYTVDSVFTQNQEGIDRISKLKFEVNISNSFIYRFIEVLESKTNIGAEVIFLESSLRKKHQPGEMSFNELINSLKSPVKVD